MECPQCKESVSEVCLSESIGVWKTLTLWAAPTRRKPVWMLADGWHPQGFGAAAAAMFMSQGCEAGSEFMKKVCPVEQQQPQVQGMGRGGRAQAGPAWIPTHVIGRYRPRVGRMLAVLLALVRLDDRQGGERGGPLAQDQWRVPAGGHSRPE